MTTETKTVFIIGDEQDWTVVLRELALAAGFGCTVLESTDQLIEAAKRSEGTCCAFVAYQQGLNGEGICQKMIEKAVAVPIVVVAQDCDLENARREVSGLAGSVVIRASMPTLLRESMMTAFRKQKVIQHQYAVQRNYRRLTSLSDRERVIVDLVVDGAPNKKIAVELGLSIKTIERVRQSAYRKLSVRSTAEMTKVVILGELHDITCESAHTAVDARMDSSPLIAPVVPPPMGLDRSYVNG